MPGHGSAFLLAPLIKSIRKTWFSRGRGPGERLRRDKPAGDEPHPAEDIACAVSSAGAGAGLAWQGSQVTRVELVDGRLSKC